MKCEAYFRSFSRIKIHKAKKCPAESYEYIKNDTKEQLDADSGATEDEFPSEVKTEPDEIITTRSVDRSLEFDIKREDEVPRDPYAGGVYRPAAVVMDSDSEYEVESDDSAPEEGDIEAQLGMLTKWNPHKHERRERRKRKRDLPSNAKIVYMVSATGQQVKRFKVEGKQRWTPPQPWIPFPTQVTVQQCCTFFQLRDYPIIVNQNLKERFKDKKQFDKFAIPLLGNANPTAHPLILATLLRAKWFEVMNTETAEERRCREGENIF